jgi:hypothetical protein
MDEDAERAAIRARIKAISEGSGLRRRGLAASLGEGLRLLWKIESGRADSSVRRTIGDHIARMILSVPDDSAERFVARAGQLSFNISDLTEGRVLGYTERRTFLDKKYRDRKGLPAPKSGYRSKNSVINDANRVYEHMARAIWDDWKKAYPGKAFPRDAPQVVDDAEEQANVKAAETEDPPKANHRILATVRASLLQNFLKRRIVISGIAGVVILIAGLVYALDSVSATDANLSAALGKAPDLVNGRPVPSECPAILGPANIGHGNSVLVVLSQKPVTLLVGRRLLPLYLQVRPSDTSSPTRITVRKFRTRLLSGLA